VVIAQSVQTILSLMDRWSSSSPVRAKVRSFADGNSSSGLPTLLELPCPLLFTAGHTRWYVGSENGAKSFTSTYSGVVDSGQAYAGTGVLFPSFKPTEAIRLVVSAGKRRQLAT
jgi:hypothetical protein